MKKTENPEWRKWRASLGGKNSTGGQAFVEVLRTCPHCGKTGHGRTMYRWHFNKCVLKNETNQN